MRREYSNIKFAIIVLFNYIISIHGISNIGLNINNWVTDSFHGIMDDHIHITDNVCISHFVKKLIPDCGILYSKENTYLDLCSDKCCEALIFPNIYDCPPEWLDISNAIIRQIQRDASSNCTSTCNTESICPFSQQTLDTPCSAQECRSYFKTGLNNQECDSKISNYCEDSECNQSYNNLSINTCINNFINYTIIDQECFDFLQVIIGIQESADVHVTDNCYTVTKDKDVYSINNCFIDINKLKTTESVEHIIIGSFIIMIQLYNFYILTK